MSGITLSALTVFPVKSLRGIAVDRWQVTARGLRMDRELMLVDARGVFVSQREEPRLALVTTELTGDRLVVRAPQQSALEIALDRRSDARVPVTIWKDTVAAEPIDRAADDWFSRALGREVRLVRFPDDAHRQVDRQYARQGDAVGFADGFPFLLASESSLADLSTRVDSPLAMARFRPNLVVAGSAPYAEDGWRRLRIGAVELELVKPCARCVVTTIDPDTGVAGLEPLRTLASYRNAGGKVLFGWNLVHRTTGALSVGDSIDILA
jgi:uncharacterized protein YcbX